MPVVGARRVNGANVLEAFNVRPTPGGVNRAAALTAKFEQHGICCPEILRSAGRSGLTAGPVVWGPVDRPPGGVAKGVWLRNDHDH